MFIKICHAITVTIERGIWAAASVVSEFMLVGPPPIWVREATAAWRVPSGQKDNPASGRRDLGDLEVINEADISVKNGGGQHTGTVQGGHDLQGLRID